MSKEKFILLHVSQKDSEDLLNDAIEVQGCERGLMMRSSLPSAIIGHFKVVKERGYIPVGVIIEEDSNNIEFLFSRHPDQTKGDRFAEMKVVNPTKL
jgi:hypothetical protein